MGVVQVLNTFFCRYYALQVASKIHSVGLKVEICDLPSTNSTIDEVEDAMARGCLFVVIITEMHVERNSVTVDILHGVPEGFLSSILITFLPGIDSFKASLQNY